LDKYLLISSSEKITEALVRMLNQTMQCKIDIITSSGQARRTLLDSEYDLIFINTPLTDETGIELSIDIAEKNDSGVLLLVKAELADQIQEKVEEYGVFVVGKPINRDLMFSALKFVNASRKKILALRQKEQELNKKMDTMKSVDRAKCCLIQFMNITEEQAHHYIERQAMNLRKPKKEIAEDIIRTYET